MNTDDQAGRWLTAVQSAQLLGVPASTFRSWHCYGIYRACQEAERGRVYYYADDVLDLYNLTKDASKVTLDLIRQRLNNQEPQGATAGSQPR